MSGEIITEAEQCPTTDLESAVSEATQDVFKILILLSSAGRQRVIRAIMAQLGYGREVL